MRVRNEQDLLNECVVKANSKDRSIRRTREKFKYIIDEWKDNNMNLYFITFTFKEEYNQTNFKNWDRKKFTNYLRRHKIKANFILYNDFGEENGRFHLHGIMATYEKLNVKEEDYFNKFGHTKIKEIYSDITRYCIKYSVKFEYDTFRRILIVRI